MVLVCFMCGSRVVPGGSRVVPVWFQGGVMRCQVVLVWCLGGSCAVPSGSSAVPVWAQGGSRGTRGGLSSPGEPRRLKSDPKV